LSFLHRVKSPNEYHLCIVNKIQTKVKQRYEKFTQSTKPLKSILLIANLYYVYGIRSNGQQIKPSNSGYAPVNGIKVYYEVYGEGRPLVLLHGAFYTIDMNWGQLIPELSKTRKVIAIEMQGTWTYTLFRQRIIDYYLSK
jgi:hypothetical protein